jgi:peptide/nickel transport system substrate-binding protein
MYLEQKSILDLDERAEVIKEMQRIVYEASPYVVLYYDTSLQAYRSDRWTGFRPQPDPGGDLLASYGPLSLISIWPLSDEESQAAARGPSSGIPAGVWIGIAVVVVAAVGFFVFVRARGGSEDRA